MQATVLVRRETGLLLSEVVRIGPACHAGIGPPLGREIGEAGIGAVVGGVPTEEHAWITTIAALLDQIKEWNPRAMKNAGVARDPLQGISPCWIGLQGLQNVPTFVRVDFVPADEPGGLAMGARDVLRGQDLKEATLVTPLDDVLLDHDAFADGRIRHDQLLAERQVVTSLIRVVRQEKALIAMRPLDQPDARTRQEQDRPISSSSSLVRGARSCSVAARRRLARRARR